MAELYGEATRNATRSLKVVGLIRELSDPNLRSGGINRLVGVVRDIDLHSSGTDMEALARASIDPLVANIIDVVFEEYKREPAGFEYRARKRLAISD